LPQIGTEILHQRSIEWTLEQLGTRLLPSRSHEQLLRRGRIYVRQWRR
jgi:hypothetical protein